MQCFAGSIFPDSSLLSRGWSVGHGCTHLDLFMCSVAQNDPKLSQIIKNTSIATVTGTMNFCCLPVTLFQPLIAQCQIKHSHCIRLILFNLDSSQFVCGILLIFYMCLSNVIKKSDGVIEILFVEYCEFGQNSLYWSHVIFLISWTELGQILPNRI